MTALSRERRVCQRGPVLAFQFVWAIGCTAAGDSAIERLPADFPDDPDACHWVYAFGTVDEFTAWEMSHPLPEADLAADVDISYSQELVAGDLWFWRSGGGDEVGVIGACSDSSPVVVGHRLEATAGTLLIDATWVETRTGDCESEGLQHIYDATLRFVGVEMEGEVIEIESLSASIGEWNCFG